MIWLISLSCSLPWEYTSPRRAAAQLDHLLLALLGLALPHLQPHLGRCSGAGVQTQVTDNLVIRSCSRPQVSSGYPGDGADLQ